MIWLCTTEKEQSACLLNSLHEPWCCSKCHLPDSSHPSMWFTSLTQTYQTPKFNRWNSSRQISPSLSCARIRYTCLRQIQTHTYGRIHARTREVACECTITVSAATYASWMFASDIQINGAAKCATSVLLQPTLGGCTTLFSATSSQPSPGRQLRDKTIHCY